MKLEDIKIVDQNLMSNVTDYDDYSKLDIAIIGMAFEFPQANTAEQFWDNLVNGKSRYDHYRQIEKKILKNIFLVF